MTPRLEDLVAAAHPFYEVVEACCLRIHYQHTLGHWLARLRSHRGEIEHQWGGQLYEDYDRYLGAAIRAFAESWQSAYQLSLRRMDV